MERNAGIETGVKVNGNKFWEETGTGDEIVRADP